MLGVFERNFSFWFLWDVKIPASKHRFRINSETPGQVSIPGVALVEIYVKWRYFLGNFSRLSRSRWGRENWKSGSRLFAILMLIRHSAVVWILMLTLNCLGYRTCYFLLLLILVRGAYSRGESFHYHSLKITGTVLCFNTETCFSN